MTSPETQPTPEPEPSTVQATPTPTEAARARAAQTMPETGTAERMSEAPTERREEESPGQERHMGGKVVHMHTAHPRVPIPYVTPGDMFTGDRATPSWLPSPRKLAFYGVLGGMAALEALEWPVALALGAATEVITREQTRRQRAEQERRGQQPAAETSARTEPSRPAQAAMA